MDLDAWLPVYERIREDLDLDRSADEAARDRLHDLLLQHELAGDPARLREVLEDRRVAVVGAGPRLPDLAAGDLRGTGPVVACDGATSRLLEVGVLPDVVVTDLDGDVGDQVEADRRGSLVVVHAHGDNVDALERWVPRFRGPLVGTTQVEPRPPVRNWGGFTDGDRAVLMADALHAREVRLVAWDLDEVGPGPTADAEAKARKLRWAREILALATVPVNPA